jgi:hypothetical protein
VEAAHLILLVGLKVYQAGPNILVNKFLFYNIRGPEIDSGLFEFLFPVKRNKKEFVNGLFKKKKRKEGMEREKLNDKIGLV